MRFALTLARRGLGRAMPNPSVGAVIVQGDGDQAEIVGAGYTARGGRPHAETQALAAAGPAAKGATIYVTLEPCFHHGQTPPCARAIIAAGIKRAVIGVLDPDERVAGNGYGWMYHAGIKVIIGVLEEEARWVSLGHISRVQLNRPFVQLKLAVSANNIVSHAQTGEPVWVTGEAARARVHLMRAQTDAVLTGIGTVLADNPELTCRLPGLHGASPVRVIVDSRLRLPLTYKLARTARKVPVWIICGSRADREDIADLERRGIEVIQVASDPDLGTDPEYLDWDVILGELARRGITRVMVEAGPQIARSLGSAAALVDEYVLFRGDKPLDSTMGTPLRQIWPHDWLERMQQCETTLPGGDSMISYR